MIDKIIDATPPKIRSQLKDTPIESIYKSRPVQRLRSKTINNEQASISTPAGTVSLLVPATAGLLNHMEYPGYEPGLVNRVSEVLDSDTVYYDIGAGYGFNCELALQVGVSPENVHLFEASAFRFPFLKKNVPSMAHTIETFVSDNDGNSSMKVDTYTSNAADPDIISMDVEGEELSAISGMQDTIEANMPELLIEVHPEWIRGGDQQLVDKLRSYGYELDARNHRVQSSDWQNLTDVSDAPRSDKTNSPTYLLRAR